MVKKLISDSQTGVNRAALDWAIQKSIPYTGFCSEKRRAEDGGLSREKYPHLTPLDLSYRDRTKFAARKSDGTMFLFSGIMDPATNETFDFCLKQGKAIFLVLLERFNDLEYREKRLSDFENWIQNNTIANINITGPRESLCQGIYKDSLQAIRFLIP